jgi:hypothetical protein
MQRYPQFFDKLLAIIEGGVMPGAVLIDGSEPDIIVGLNIKVRFDQNEGGHSLDDAEGDEGEDLLELEVVLGGRSLVVEIDKSESFFDAASTIMYSGRKFLMRLSVRLPLDLLGVGWRKPYQK